MNGDDCAFKFAAQAEKFYIREKVMEMVYFSHGDCENGYDFCVIINIFQSCYRERTIVFLRWLYRWWSLLL
jgi:hypothetical protein